MCLCKYLKESKNMQSFLCDFYKRLKVCAYFFQLKNWFKSHNSLLHKLNACYGHFHYFSVILLPNWVTGRPTITHAWQLLSRIAVISDFFFLWKLIKITQLLSDCPFCPAKRRQKRFKNYFSPYIHIYVRHNCHKFKTIFCWKPAQWMGIWDKFRMIFLTWHEWIFEGEKLMNRCIMGAVWEKEGEIKGIAHLKQIFFF